MRNIPLRFGHVLGDFAPHSDNFYHFIVTFLRGSGRAIALPRTIVQIGIEIAVPDMVALRFHQSQIHTKFARALAHRRSGEHPF